MKPVGLAELACVPHTRACLQKENSMHNREAHGRGGVWGGVEQVEKIRVNRATHLASVMHAWRGGSASV